MEDAALDALINTAIAPLLAALVLTGILRFAFGARLGPLLAGGAIGIAFSAGYVLRLGLPDFPPDAALQKLLFVALIGVGLGFIADILSAVEKFRLPMILVWPALIVAWLGWREMLDYSSEIGITVAVSWACGAFIIIRLTGQPEESKSAPALMLLFAAIGLGILALLGGSAGIAQLAAALALLILVFVAPPLAQRLPLGRHGAFGPMVLGIVAAIPIAIAVFVAL